MRITLIGESVNLKQGHGGDFSLDFLVRLLAQKGDDVTVATVNHASQNAFDSPPECEIRSAGIGEHNSATGVAKELAWFINPELHAELHDQIQESLRDFCPELVADEIESLFNDTVGKNAGAE